MQSVTVSARKIHIPPSDRRLLNGCDVGSNIDKLERTKHYSVLAYRFALECLEWKVVGIWSVAKIRSDAERETVSFLPAVELQPSRIGLLCAVRIQKVFAPVTMEN